MKTADNKPETLYDNANQPSQRASLGIQVDGELIYIYPWRYHSNHPSTCQSNSILYESFLTLHMKINIFLNCERKGTPPYYEVYRKYSTKIWFSQNLSMKKMYLPVKSIFERRYYNQLREEEELSCQ